MIRLLRTTLLLLCFAMPVRAADLTVFAAASLGDAMGELASAWEAETGHSVTMVFAGSSTLARQIDAGAPADVYVSANTAWMDWLAENKRVIETSRVDIAANRLVLVAGSPAARNEAEVTSGTDIAGLLGENGRLAVALPEAVPAGIYAKAALTELGLWKGVSSRLAPTDNVRAALALVALGEAPAGVVYATDAAAEPGVVVAGVFPETSHSPIRYPAAVVADSGQAGAAGAFVDWLTEDAAQSILVSFGFLAP
jgi:molybdate transport system substrate-binding protein